eukprot:scaffold7.g3689.t1
MQRASTGSALRYPLLQGLISSVLGAADSAVASVESIDGVLLAVQGVLGADVNASDIAAQVDCLRPWLDGLPDPAPLAAQVQGIQTALAGTVQPTLAHLSGQLSALALLAAPSGSYGQTLGALAGMGSLLSSPGDGSGLLQQMSAVIAAADALTPVQDDIAVGALQASLGALVSSPTSLDAQASRLASINASLADGLPQIRASPYPPAIAADIATLQTAGDSLETAVLALSAALAGLVAPYVIAEPCMQSLVARMQHVNDSVLVLPGALASQLATLEVARDALGELLPGGSGPSVQVQLDAAAAATNAPLATLAVALTNVQAIVGVQSSIPADMSAPASAVGDAAAALSALLATTALGDLQTATAAYLLSPSPGGYAAIRSAAQALAGNLRAPRDGLQAHVAELKATASLVDQAQADIAAADLPGQAAAAGAMQAAASGMPDLSAFQARLTSLTGAYADLPSPPSSLLTQALASVTAIVDDVSQAVASAHQTVQDVLPDVQQQISGAEDSTLGSINRYQAQFEPTILLLLWFILVVVLTAALKARHALGSMLRCLWWEDKVGNDTCVNTEGLVLKYLADMADAAAAAKMDALARYYLLDQGGTLEDVLLVTFDFNVSAINATIEAKRGEVVQQVAGAYTLQPLLASQVDAGVAASHRLQNAIAALLGQVSYAGVHPVYASVKGFACCGLLDTAGYLWLALLIAGSAGLALCLAACSAHASLDRMPDRGCCTRFRRKDFDDVEPEWLAVSGSSPGGGRAASKEQQQFIALVADARARSGSGTLEGSRVELAWKGLARVTEWRQQEQCLQNSAAGWGLLGLASFGARIAPETADQAQLLTLHDASSLEPCWQQS